MAYNTTMTDKQKLTTVLHNIIEKARMGGKLQAKGLLSIMADENFHKTIREKTEVFQNVPENSKMFFIIYDTAKRALPDLKKNIINAHALELVKLFYTLDENFRRNLTPTNFEEKEEITEEPEEPKTFCEEVKEKIEEKEKVTIELPEWVTGLEFLSAKVMDQKSFNDLNEALENL